jgi:hypothetical protein
MEIPVCQVKHPAFKPFRVASVSAPVPSSPPESRLTGGQLLSMMIRMPITVTSVSHIITWLMITIVRLPGILYDV